MVWVGNEPGRDLRSWWLLPTQEPRWHLLPVLFPKPLVMVPPPLPPPVLPWEVFYPNLLLGSFFLPSPDLLLLVPFPWMWGSGDLPPWSSAPPGGGSPAVCAGLWLYPVLGAHPGETKPGAEPCEPSRLSQGFGHSQVPQAGCSECVLRTTIPIVKMGTCHPSWLVCVVPPCPGVVVPTSPLCHRHCPLVPSAAPTKGPWLSPSHAWLSNKPCLCCTFVVCYSLAWGCWLSCRVGRVVPPLPASVSLLLHGEHPGWQLLHPHGDVGTGQGSGQPLPELATGV